jgi:hypothetical protein
LNDWGDGLSIAGEGSVVSGNSSSGCSGGSMNTRLTKTGLPAFGDLVPFAQIDRPLVLIEQISGQALEAVEPLGEVASHYWPSA